MNTERENLNQLRSSVTFKKSTPLIDSGFSSNLNKDTTGQSVLFDFL